MQFFVLIKHFLDHISPASWFVLTDTFVVDFVHFTKFGRRNSNCVNVTSSENAEFFWVFTMYVMYLVKCLSLWGLLLLLMFLLLSVTESTHEIIETKVWQFPYVNKWNVFPIWVIHASGLQERTSYHQERTRVQPY